MIHLNYPLVIYCNSLLLKIAHRNSELSHEKWWIFPSFLVCLPDRVCGFFSSSPISVEHPNSWIHKKIPPAFVPGGYHLQDLFGGLELCLEGAEGGNPLGQHHHVAGSCWVVPIYSLGTKGTQGSQRKPEGTKGCGMNM